ncbi:MAG: hypothetical protein QOF83_2778, partial [Solirubrobacteraceae bacterium]|nr:hypothetical protein [Solirubrobacteraceae bacterium]
ALKWALDSAQEHRRPVLVEIITERDTNAPMGNALNTINEFETVQA